MKIAIIGAFIFCMSFATMMYCLMKGIEEGMFVVPFFVSLLLVPYGMMKEEEV